ncbi:MAG TPA: hypothetical protein VFY93_02735 [Planctomycetota bacterium]|nr:hypothetical protein [Planctomycetota bacterium]
MRRVLQLASGRGVEPARLVGRAALWESKDVRKLKPKRVGRPKGS